MKRKTSPSSKYRQIATHALVAGIVSQPYLIYLLSDIYRIASRNTLEVVGVDQALVSAMGLFSGLALLVAAVSYGLHIAKRG